MENLLTRLVQFAIVLFAMLHAGCDDRTVCPDAVPPTDDGGALPHVELEFFRVGTATDFDGAAAACAAQGAELAVAETLGEVERIIAVCSANPVPSGGHLSCWTGGASPFGSAGSVYVATPPSTWQGLTMQASGLYPVCARPATESDGGQP